MSRTPEEQKVLDATAAAIAAGQDPFGDDEELVRDLPESADDADDKAGDDDTGEPKADEKPGEANPKETTEAKTEPEPAKKTEADPLELEQPARFTAELPKDYQEQRKALTTEKAAAMKRLMDGEIDAEQYAELESGIADKLETLMAQRIRAETLQEANIQNDAAYQAREIRKLIKETAAEVPYATDPKAVKQFDQALQVIQSDPDNSGRDYADLIGDAHRMVAALRGVQLKTPTPPAAKTEVPDRSNKETPPVTLRGLPSASTANTGGGVAESMSRLHGPEYEAAFAKLTPQQRSVLLDEA